MNFYVNESSSREFLNEIFAPKKSHFYRCSWAAVKDQVTVDFKFPGPRLSRQYPLAVDLNRFESRDSRKMLRCRGTVVERDSQGQETAIFQHIVSAGER